MTTPSRPSNPCTQLAGRSLENGWKVGELVEPNAVATGGHFSVGYLATHEDGRTGFLKALDFGDVAAQPDIPDFIQRLVTAFNFERELLKRTQSRRMSRVIQALEYGEVEVPGSVFGRVPYLIFEFADGSDVRQYLSTSAQFDVAWKLRTLHHASVGLRQLHADRIAHQDLKPSNVLVFENIGSKIGDLGRASIKGTDGPSDQWPIAGAKPYAPPEQLYGHIDSDWDRRRLGTDLYHLGSLAVFFFTNQSMNSILIQFLHNDHRPGNTGLVYKDILPYVQAAFGQALNAIEPVIPDSIKTDLIPQITYLCDPNPETRGHPLARRRGGRQCDIDRFVSAFNLLATKAETGLK